MSLHVPFYIGNLPFRVSLRQFELTIFRPIVSWYLILFFASLFAREVYSEIVENCR